MQIKWKIPYRKRLNSNKPESHCDYRSISLIFSISLFYVKKNFLFKKIFINLTFYNSPLIFHPSKQYAFLEGNLIKCLVPIFFLKLHVSKQWAFVCRCMYVIYLLAWLMFIAYLEPWVAFCMLRHKSSWKCQVARNCWCGDNRCPNYWKPNKLTLMNM